MENNFSQAFETFFKACVAISDQYMADQFPNNPIPVFSVNEGKRYMKVVRDGSAHCFVDTTNGNVLLAAGWSAPAKGARGNIFDEKNGVGRMGPHGPAYNR